MKLNGYVIGGAVLVVFSIGGLVGRLDGLNVGHDKGYELGKVEASPNYDMAIQLAVAKRVIEEFRNGSHINYECEERVVDAYVKGARECTN